VAQGKPSLRRILADMRPLLTLSLTLASCALVAQPGNFQRQDNLKLTASKSKVESRNKPIDFELEKAKDQTGYSLVSTQAKRPLEGNSYRGATLFQENCSGCHRPYSDHPESQMKLNPEPPDLRMESGYKYGRGDLAVFRTIRFGVDNTGMAGWGDSPIKNAGTSWPS